MKCCKEKPHLAVRNQEYVVTWDMDDIVCPQAERHEEGAEKVLKTSLTDYLKSDSIYFTNESDNLL